MCGKSRDRRIGWSLQDSKLKLDYGLRTSSPSYNPIEAKFRALNRGLQIAISHRLASLVINTDVREVIKMLHTRNLKYDYLICEYRCLMNRLDKVDVLNVFREKNKVAHELAQEGARRKTFGTIVIFVIPPVFIE